MAKLKTPAIMLLKDYWDSLYELSDAARGRLIARMFEEAYDDLPPMQPDGEGVDSALYRAAERRLIRTMKEHFETFEEMSKRNSENAKSGWKKKKDVTECDSMQPASSRNATECDPQCETMQPASSRNATECDPQCETMQPASSRGETYTETETEKKPFPKPKTKTKTNSAASSTGNNFSTGGPGFKQGREIIGNLYPDLKAKYEAEESGAETGPQVHDPPTAELAAAQRRLDELKRQKT